jgi:hypothetical protein
MGVFQGVVNRECEGGAKQEHGYPSALSVSFPRRELNDFTIGSNCGQICTCTYAIVVLTSNGFARSPCGGNYLSVLLFCAHARFGRPLRR